MSDQRSKPPRKRWLRPVVLSSRERARPLARTRDRSYLGHDAAAARTRYPMSPPDSSEAPIRAATPETTFTPARAPARAGWLRRLRWPLMLGAVVLAVVIGVVVYLTGGREQSTDDAQIDGARVQVSSSISGRVVAIDVHEGQLVRTGQLLFQLDGRPYQTASAEAEANLAQARLQVTALRAT